MDGISIMDLYNLPGVQLGYSFALCIVHSTRDGLLGILDRVLYCEPWSVIRVGLGGVSAQA